MENLELQKEVVAIVSHVAKVPESRINADTDLRNDLNVDSLQGLQIVARVERKYDITIPDEELDMYSSVRLIVAQIERIIQEQQTERVDRLR